MLESGPRREGKTKIMSNSQKINEIRIDNNVIEKVSEYRYLGQIIYLDDRMNKEITLIT